MQTENRLIEGRHESGDSALARRLFAVIFQSDTPAGRAFDVLLIGMILASVLAVMLSSVASLNTRYGAWFYRAEWVFTVAFTVEYALRLYCVRRPAIYARSFFGIVDLLSFLPLYLELLVTGAGYFLVIRVLRVLRLFRILKLVRYVGEAEALVEALIASRRKIIVFVYTVLTLVVIFGALMYFVEGAASGFTSIPKGMYWAIVTLTTVGYGDIAPITPLGQTISAIVMILGYGIIAVPTGIYASELMQVMQRRRQLIECPGCGLRDHAADAVYCRGCGTRLKPEAKAVGD